jgi:glycosyltransferase involved in cell wall biosynthesis
LIVVPAIASPASIRKRRRICVLVPAYNHQQYVGEAIASVLAQDWPDIQLLVMDDGSTDGTLDVAARAIKGERRVACSLTSQSNAGVSITLNRLMESADGELLAILNSDDCYAPGRLERIAGRAEGNESFFGFSGVDFVETGGANDLARLKEWYADALRMAACLPSAGFAMLLANLTISSSNFVFSRDLVAKSGGFDPSLPLTQDWDFVLRCLPFAEPVFQPESLLRYRVHPLNTWRNHKATEVAQSRAVLGNFFERAVRGDNPLAPQPRAWPRFFPIFLSIAWQVAADESVGHFLRRLNVNPKSNPRTLPVGDWMERDAIAKLVAAAQGMWPSDDRANLFTAVAGRWEANRQGAGS